MPLLLKIKYRKILRGTPVESRGAPQSPQQDSSSIGRASVSKTEGCRFKSCLSCHEAQLYQILMFRKISTFVGEVKTELRKASWPWDPDPKVKGFRKYKELIDSTLVILVAMILLAAYVALWDLIHREVVDFLTGIGR